jgi:hypothetical protein
MNTYDPADLILYVNMTREIGSDSPPLEGGLRCNKLPASYANRSSRTRLRGAKPCRGQASDQAAVHCAFAGNGWPGGLSLSPGRIILGFR